jgi:hypothetical protein
MTPYLNFSIYKLDDSSEQVKIEYEFSTFIANPNKGTCQMKSTKLASPPAYFGNKRGLIK